MEHTVYTSSSVIGRRHQELKTFPARSSKGPDGLTAQHLSDLLAGASDEQLKINLTDFVNVLLQEDLPTEVRDIFWRQTNRTAKEEWGDTTHSVWIHTHTTCPKYTNAYVITHRSDELQPTQVGVWVSGGAEAAVHTMRRLVSNMPDDHVLVKLDFSSPKLIYNTYNESRQKDHSRTHLNSFYYSLELALNSARQCIQLYQNDLLKQNWAT